MIDARKQSSDFFVVHNSEDGPFGNLESVDMEDGKDSARLCRVEILDSVPGSRSRTSFCLSVADDASDNEVRVVHYRTEGNAESVTELTALVNGSRGFGVDMTDKI